MYKDCVLLCYTERKRPLPLYNPPPFPHAHRGPARRIPPPVIELVKTVNRTLRLGNTLCLSRSPDFLLDIIRRQGTMESMKWLTDLVEASHSSLEVLPVPCLCEFLMAGYQDKSGGGGGLDSGESDSLSHRTHYKRKKSAKDKVGVYIIAGNFCWCKLSCKLYTHAVKYFLFYVSQWWRFFSPYYQHLHPYTIENNLLGHDFKKIPLIDRPSVLVD